MVQNAWVLFNNKMCENIGNDVLKTGILLTIDQSTYGLFYLSPSFTIFFMFRGFNFNIVKLWRNLKLKKFFFRDYPVTASCNLLCWIPGMLIVYCLPQKIQYPLTILLQLVYSLMISFSNIISSRVNKQKTTPTQRTVEASEHAD